MVRWNALCVDGEHSVCLWKNVISSMAACICFGLCGVHGKNTHGNSFSGGKIKMLAACLAAVNKNICQHKSSVKRNIRPTAKYATIFWCGANQIWYTHCVITTQTFFAGSNQLSRCGQRVKERAGQNKCSPLLSVSQHFCRARSTSFRPQRLSCKLWLCHGDPSLSTIHRIWLSSALHSTARYELI